MTTSKQKQEEQKVKPLVNLMPKYELEESCYKNALIKDIKTGKWHSWPKLTDVTQIAYETHFLDRVVDSETGQYYPKKDEDGKPLKTTPHNVPKYSVISIIRYRKSDGTEFLLSKGNLIGHDALGDEIRYFISKPEVWNKTHFKYEKQWNDKKKMLEKNCQGPSLVEQVYTLPFNEKNLKELFDKRQDDNIQWVVKDDQGAKAVSGGPNINDTFKLFLKPFEFLYNAQYLTPEMKAQYRQEAIDAGILSAPSAAATVAQTSTLPKAGAYN